MKVFKKFLALFSALIILLAILVFLAFKYTPWPSALLIRHAFDKEGLKVNEALKKHVPPGVSEILDQQYIQRDKDAKLDVYYPSKLVGTNQIQPVIVWIHGGGWISGSKDQVANYCKILASRGYAVIAVDYSIAPEKKYPAPLRQTVEALQYISRNSKRLHADSSHMILAGDSGGAQIAAQVANMISDPSYAKQIGISPGIQRSQLSGLILYCGPYDANNIDLKGDFGTFIKTVLWSYSGKKDFSNEPSFKMASIINYVNNNFPPCFISVGNDDPLLPQSQALARKLQSLNVPVDTLFFKADYSPALPHEYQFNLDRDAGRLALESSVRFIKAL